LKEEELQSLSKHNRDIVTTVAEDALNKRLTLLLALSVLIRSLADHHHQKLTLIPLALTALT